MTHPTDLTVEQIRNHPALWYARTSDVVTTLLAALPAAPAPIATPADDAVARALRDIKAMSLGHHAHEDPAVLLHALLVEIPSAIDAALGGD